MPVSGWERDVKLRVYVCVHVCVSLCASVCVLVVRQLCVVCLLSWRLLPLLMCLVHVHVNKQITLIAPTSVCLCVHVCVCVCACGTSAAINNKGILQATSSSSLASSNRATIKCNCRSKRASAGRSLSPPPACYMPTGAQAHALTFCPPPPFPQRVNGSHDTQGKQCSGVGSKRGGGESVGGNP